MRDKEIAVKRENKNERDYENKRERERKREHLKRADDRELSPIISILFTTNL